MQFKLPSIFKSKPKSLESQFTRAELSAIGWNGSKSPYGIPSPLLSENTFKDAFTSHISGRNLDFNAREATEKNAIGAGIIATKELKIINAGLRLQASPAQDLIPFDLDWRLWGKNVESRFKLWANSKASDFSFSMTFGQMQTMMLRNYLIDGKAMAVLRYIASPEKGRLGRLCVQLVPKSQLCSFAPKQISPKNEFYNGMEINPHGEVVAYWFEMNSPYDITKVREPVRINRWGRLTNREVVLDMTNSPRVGDHFGISKLAVILEDLFKIEQYRLAELKAAAVNASIALIASNNQDTPVNPFSGGVGKRVGEKESAQNNDEIITTERSGMIVVQGGKGDKLEGFDTKRPNLNFGNFVDAITKQISASCGIPVEILNKKFETSYSAARGAINEFYEEILRERALITSSFNNPIYAAWLHDEVINGRILCPGYFAEDTTERQLIRTAYQQAKWAGLPRQNLDPVKEAKALEIAEAHGWSTAEEIAESSYNSDFYLNAKKRKQEKEALGTDET